MKFIKCLDGSYLNILCIKSVSIYKISGIFNSEENGEWFNIAFSMGGDEPAYYIDQCKYENNAKLNLESIIAALEQKDD